MLINGRPRLIFVTVHLNRPPSKAKRQVLNTRQELLKKKKLLPKAFITKQLLPKASTKARSFPKNIKHALLTV